MSIVTLKEKENLRNEMAELLQDYQYNYNNSALERIINTWAENKAPLIEAFRKHPNYIEGKFMIAFDVDYDRDIDKSESMRFSGYLRELMEKHINDFPSDMIEQRRKCGLRLLPGNLFNFLANLENHAERTLEENIAKAIDKECPNAHVHAGMKTSRAVNKICAYLGFDKDEDYNRNFARYADSLSPLKIKRHTVLSLNPLDYLEMSNGNSWTSCHSIKNRGCYSSGTISYMLDESSMVFYTIDSSYDGNEYYNQPKIIRQMYHYGEDKLVQGRLYPQSNDYGAKDEYESCRNIVQKIVSEIFDFPNRWIVKHGTDAISPYVHSEGTHYTDYLYFSNCTLSRPRDNENEKVFTIGHDPICIHCGEEHDTEDSIDCCEGNGRYCADCGAWISEDDVIWIGDEPYCSNCVEYCSCCEEYYPVHDEGVWIASENRYVCNDCAERYYTYCEDCGEYYPNDEMNYIDSVGHDVCNECLADNYSMCSECGEFFENDQLHEYNGELYCSDCYDEVTEKEEEKEAC